MTAPRLREQRRPPSPPDRLPSPRGGHPSPSTASAAKRLAGFARLAGARRGLVHSARPLAAAALLALFGALALPATAQAQEIVLVSNIAERNDGSFSIRSPTFQIGTIVFGERKGAQQFTTGLNTAGYVLQSVTLDLTISSGEDQVVHVAIHENNSSGRPGAQLAVLDNPAGPIGGNRTYSAPSPLSLVASTQYWVVLSNTATTSSFFDVSHTQSNDQTTTQGFSIRNTRFDGTPGSWSEATDYAVRMEVRGTVATPSTDATLSDLVVNDGNANLTLTPTFASGIYTYTASVVSTVAEVTVTAMTTDSGATIEYLDASDATLDDADTGVTGHQVAVAVGETFIQVKVTAADGNTTQTYVVKVDRAADTDTTAPTLTRAFVEESGTSITVIFSEELDLQSQYLSDAVIGAFTVTADDVELEVGSVLLGLLEDLVIVLSTPIYPGQTVVVSYNQSVAGGDALADAAGNEVASFTTGRGGVTAVTNNSTVPPATILPDAPGVEGQFRIAPDTVEGYSDDTLGRLNGHVGRAEIFHAGRWGTVSSDGFSRDTTSRFIEDLDTNGDPLGTYTYGDVDNNAPALFCQAMSYDTGEYASGYGRPGVPSQRSESEMPYYPVGSTYPSDGPEPIWVDDMTCAAGDADLTVGALPVPMAHCGYAGWGLHNSNHGEDAGVRCWNEPESDAGRSYDPLTAAFEGLPEAHDGETAFSFRLAFSEAVAVTPEAMRTRALTVAGGAVTGAARVDGESGVWEITVTPDSREDLSITLARTEDCEAEGAVCTSDGRTLSAVPAHIVPGPGPETEPALTAELQGLPEVHDGEDTFHFRVAFSENIGIGFRSMRDDSFTVDGGEVIAARRVEGRHDLWQITVEPDSDGDVAIALPGGRECAVSGAICTRGENRRQLANTPTATVPGPSDDAPEPNTAATGTPAIGGTPQVGEELSASTSGISDADGLDDASFAYQWIRASADIDGATGSTYTPVAADEGKRLKVRVSFTDDAGNEERLTSTPVGASRSGCGSARTSR